MCPTPVGRIHTRSAIIIGPAILGAILSLITGNLDWIVIIGVYYLMGIFLDVAVYAVILRYQPPWMGGVLALVEWGLLLALTRVLEGFPNVTVLEASIFYWVSWIIAASTKIVVLPIVSLTYLESAGEFRSTQWSVPAQNVSVPVLAASEEAKRGPGPVLKEASGVHAKPLQPLPAPSGVHSIPQPQGQG